MAVFIDLWPCLFTTKLSYTQLFKWGHSNLAAECNCGAIFFFSGTPIVYLYSTLLRNFTKALTRLLLNDEILFEVALFYYILKILATALTFKGTEWNSFVIKNIVKIILECILPHFVPNYLILPCNTYKIFTDYGHPDSFFSKILNFWAWADKLGRIFWGHFGYFQPNY